MFHKNILQNALKTSKREIYSVPHKELFSKLECSRI